MNELSKYVDPFLGNGEINLPKPEGIAATWFFIKAQSGNTHPGASLPFGMISACPFTGGYPTGYGINCPNYHSKPTKFTDKIRISGFTHMHLNGTGAAGKYYNYVRVVPLNGALSKINHFNDVVCERAVPGYYCNEFAGTNIKSELTVFEKGAFHRYTFKDSTDKKIAIDFSAEGIPFEKTPTKPSQQTELRIISKKEVQCSLAMHGVKIYIYAECDANIRECKLWTDKKAVEEPELSYEKETFEQFGAVFEIEDFHIKSTDLKIGFSLIGFEKAKKNLELIKNKSFEQVVEENAILWKSYLDKIELQDADQKQQEIFYSNFYHSLVKPANFNGENPFWESEELYLDFITFWDIYKTQMPLVFTLYPEVAKDIINSLIGLGKYIGELPISIFLSDDFKVERKQARTLVHFLMMDAFYRKIEGINWKDALEVMLTDIYSDGYKDFIETGYTERFTHILDMSDACYYTAQLAKHLGEIEIYNKLIKLSKNWNNAYDKKTGLLSEKSPYYEGGNWNYSFRLQHNMKERIALYKKEEDFVRDLDLFFGYGQTPVRQPYDPDNSDYIDEYGLGLNRFEGFNNEPDMETPYAYIFAGRHDRTAEVVRAGCKYMYTNGRGGIPGNNDSGAMSSCYIWNVIGIFPVAGQPLFLIGSPIFNRIVLKLIIGDFVIETVNNSDENIYVQSAKLNEKKINRAYLSVDEVMSGGKLTLVMGSKPSDWAGNNRPHQ